MYDSGLKVIDWLVASAMKDKTVAIWDVKTGKLTILVTNLISLPLSLVPMEGCLAAGREIIALSFGILGPNSIRSFSFSPDTSIVASASWDKTVCLSKIDTGELLKRISHNNSVESVDFSPDGKGIVTGSNDDRTIQYGKVRIYDVKSGRVDHYIYCVAFHPSDVGL